MGIEILRFPGVNGINANNGVNSAKFRQSFRGNSAADDKFESSSVNRYTSEFYLQKALRSNPKISRILTDAGVPVKLNMEQLNNLLQTHAQDTKNIALGICENLPFSLKNQVDVKTIGDGAYLHDVGKALIPPEILNKNGKLDERETEIMHKHSELGYELLKDYNIPAKTLHIIRNHHQNIKKSGYPWVGQNFNADLNLQIVSAADKFSALTEKRPYKEPLDSKQALTIMYKDVEDGKLHPFVFKALVNYAQISTQHITSSKNT